MTTLTGAPPVGIASVGPMSLAPPPVSGAGRGRGRGLTRARGEGQRGEGQRGGGQRGGGQRSEGQRGGRAATPPSIQTDAGLFAAFHM